MKAITIYMLYSGSVKLNEAQQLKVTCQAVSSFCPVFQLEQGLSFCCSDQAAGNLGQTDGACTATLMHMGYPSPGQVGGLQEHIKSQHAQISKYRLFRMQKKN